MRVAAIDCGTNTVLLLVAEVGAGGPEAVTAVEEQAEIVRLGEGLDRTGVLSEAAMARTLAVLGRYAERARALGCARLIAVGTEAIRAAKNGADFLRQADALLAPARLEGIDGQREARLSFAAVRAAFPPARGPRVLVDIGGGSTEILVGGDTVERAVSIPIGSVRLTERLLAHDPPSDDEQRALGAAIAAALAGAPSLPAGAEVIGIAGTVTTLAAMAEGIASVDPARVHGARLSRSALAALVEELGRTPLAVRRTLPGLDPRRADVIYAGARILLAVIDRAGADGCLVSDRGIRWGLVYEAAGLA